MIAVMNQMEEDLRANLRLYGYLPLRTNSPTERHVDYDISKARHSQLRNRFVRGGGSEVLPFLVQLFP